MPINGIFLLPPTPTALTGFGRTAAGSPRALAAIAMFAVLALLPAPLAAQTFQPAPPPGAGANPICQRLEGQLASITQGGDSGQSAQERRFEEAIQRQEAELERAVLQARRQGCESTGLFALFNGQAAQCGPLNNRIQQMRSNLDRMIGDVQRMRSGNAAADRETQRRSVILALAQNNCGPQYAAAARQFQQGGLFEGLFGNNWSGPSGPQSGNTFRTVCVRTCDGYFFPISFATTLDHVNSDARTCQQQCPAAEAQLFYHRNPGEDMTQAVSLSGTPYTSLPNAFKYRQEFNAACTCKPAGQSWADAMRHLDDRGALREGDIIVTDERAKRMSQAPQTKSSGAQAPDATNAASQKQAAPTTPNGTIRSVGPIFVEPKDKP